MIPRVSKGPQPFGALFGPFPALEKGLAPQRETLRKNYCLAIDFRWSCLRRPIFFVWAKKMGKRSPAGACGPLHPGDKKVPLRSAALYVRPPDGGRDAASAAFGAGRRCGCDGQAVFLFVNYMNRRGCASCVRADVIILILTSRNPSPCRRCPRNPSRRRHYRRRSRRSRRPGNPRRRTP